MAVKNEERDIYYIPPNFLTGGRLFGGSIRMRNAVEAGILALLTGIPLFRLPFPLTTRIILLCLVTLPLAIFGLAGFEGVSLSEFAAHWLKWVTHRRVLYRTDAGQTAEHGVPNAPGITIRQTSKRHAPPGGLGIRVKSKPGLKEKLASLYRHRESFPTKTSTSRKTPQTAEDFIPISDIRDSIIETTDGRYIKMRVLIPYREMTFREWPADELPPRSVHAFMQRILGATVDFIPAGVDVRNRAAVGSRKAAMLKRQDQYYASGRVQPGILIACRVLAIGNNTMTVEACGVDTEIFARDVSWEWFPDISDRYSTGDLVVARVMSVALNEETGRYSVDLSIKAASEHSDKLAFEKLVPRTNYLGVVTGSKHGLFFIRLQDGANAKTRVYRCKEYPSKQDTVCFHVTSLDEKNMVAKGFITRIIKRHDRLR